MTRPRFGARVTSDGFDRIGPFHPAIAWAGVLLLDLLAVLLVLAAVTVAADRIEDLVAPGGVEWVQL